MPVLLVLAAAAAACVGDAAPRLELLLDRPQTAPPEVQRACTLVLRKCTRCHTLDRILVMRPEYPAGWQQLVISMRRMSGSAISLPEQRDITRCLVYRTFGEPGLQALQPAAELDSAASPRGGRS